MERFKGKLNFALSRKYSSDSYLNYSHLNSIIKKDEYILSNNINYNEHQHHCNEGSVKVVSYEQFVKLIKSSELK